MNQHVSVLLHEAITALNIQPHGNYVDATFGRGGHSRAILARLEPPGTLYAIDQDQQAITVAQQLQKQYPQLRVVKGNFANLSALLAVNNVDAVDGLIFDLGVSSPQFDNPKRGFSYQHEGPLDMRMDQNHPVTAAHLVNELSLSDLTHLLERYGEEPNAKMIAQEIIRSRPLATTTDLVRAIKRALPAKALRQKGHPARRTFQALRISVNRELGALALALEQGLNLLKPHGRLVVISFHSLEEKAIKAAFRKVTINDRDEVVAKLPMMLPTIAEYRLIKTKNQRPQGDEIKNNRRAHSAKLWIIERLEQPR